MHDPRVVHVRSNNDVLQTLHALQRNRSKRTQRREFLIEGVRAINQAVLHGWQINAFIHGAERGLSDWALQHLHTRSAQHHYVLADSLMADLSQRTETSELMATVVMPPDDPARISAHVDRRISAHIEGRISAHVDGRISAHVDRRISAHIDQHTGSTRPPASRDAVSNRAPLVVLFDRPASPGNLGSLIRSCDALGADGLLVTGHATDVYDPECVRASTGSLFSVPVVRIHQQAVLNNWLGTFRERWPTLQQVGADEAGPCRLDEHDFRAPTLLLLGNETWGLSAGYKAQCDVLVHIPMHGAASSLNVASAGSILLYEIARQRAVAASEAVQAS